MKRLKEELAKEKEIFDEELRRSSKGLEILERVEKLEREEKFDEALQLLKENKELLKQIKREMRKLRKEEKVVKRKILLERSIAELDKKIRNIEWLGGLGIEDVLKDKRKLKELKKFASLWGLSAEDLKLLAKLEKESKA